MNRDTIKYIAMGTMLLNHIANVVLKPGTTLYEVMIDMGYFTAVTMCCFLVEGYDYTSSKPKYALRLAGFAVLSELPYCLAFTENGLLSFCGMNMIFTLLLCFGIIHAMNTFPYGAKRMAAVAGLTLLSIFSDWALLAPVFTIWFVRAKGNEKKLKQAFLKCMALFGILNLASYLEQYAMGPAVLRAVGSTLGIAAAGVCILFFYNGKRMERGRAFSKWFFYLFYPVHLLILGLLRIGSLNL